jgi:RNase P/RNase MRP subunit POP5
LKLKQKPSAKIHRRYLLIIASKKEIERVILEYLGVLGWAKAVPVFVAKTGHKDSVLAVERKSLEDVRAAFEIAESKAKILKVSGTLKGLAK